jgi:phytoene/squalene synthetase
MRKIDDLIDHYKERHEYIREEDRAKFIGKVDDWLQMVRTSRRTYPFQKELISTINRFRIPVWTIENFARSMVYDINNDGFPTVKAFLDYSEGATVAPSSIFVHLCGIRKDNGVFRDHPAGLPAPGPGAGPP